MAPSTALVRLPGHRGPRVDLYTTKLRATREARGLTQLELAVAAGITPATLSRLENGHQLPNLHTVYRLAQTLGVQIEELIG